MRGLSIKTYYSLKLAALAGLIFLLFCGAMFLYLLPELEKEFIKRKKETLRATTQIAISHIGNHQKQSDIGEISIEEAQARALRDIGSYRYGKEGRDYFWINDMSGMILMHPYREDLVGVKNNQLEEAAARSILLDFVDIVKREGQGYSSYLWQWQDDPSRVLEKISYVEGYSRWQWIIGTGFYVYDIKDDLAKLTRHVMLVLIVTLICIAILLFFIVYKAVLANAAHQRATMLLEQSEKRFRELAELLPEGIFECELDLKITYANNRALQMFGYSATDLNEDFNTLQIFNGEGQRRVKEIFQRKLSREETGSSEYLVTRKDGSQFPVLLHSSCIEEENKIIGFRGVVVDISRQKEIEEQLVQHRDNLEHHVNIRTRELKAALTEVNILSGLIPICANCKKIRDDKGFWEQVDTYIAQHTNANFSHSTCPDCEEVLYGEQEWYKKHKDSK